MVGQPNWRALPRTNGFYCQLVKHKTLVPRFYQLRWYPELEILFVLIPCSKHTSALDIGILRELPLDAPCEIHGEKIFERYTSRDNIAADAEREKARRAEQVPHILFINL